MRLGRHVLLIGHRGHPEVVGTMGQLPEGAISLIETEADVETFSPDDPAALGFVTQTTLSIEETAGIIAALTAKFPAMTAPSSESICYATTNRQDAVKAAAPGTDLFITVGAPNSSNSKRLVEVAERLGAGVSVLVEGVGDVPWDVLDPAKIGAREAVVGLSAGASAPEVLVDAIVDAFRERFDVTVDFVETAIEDENFPVMRSLRQTPLTREDMAFVNGMGERTVKNGEDRAPSTAAGAR